MIHRIITYVGIGMIVFPEPITTFIGFLILILLYRFRKRRCRKIVYPSGVIIRRGNLPQRSSSY